MRYSGIGGFVLDGGYWIQDGKRLILDIGYWIPNLEFFNFMALIQDVGTKIQGSDTRNLKPVIVKPPCAMPSAPRATGNPLLLLHLHHTPLLDFTAGKDHGLGPTLGDLAHLYFSYLFTRQKVSAPFLAFDNVGTVEHFKNHAGF